MERISDDRKISKEDVLLEEKYYDDVEYVLIPHDDLLNNIKNLAGRIRNDYKEVYFLCVLEGAKVFYDELKKHLGNLKFEEGFVSAKSYSNTGSTGDIRVKGFDFDELKEKNVLIVDDILDTGRTLHKILKDVKRSKPQSLEISVLFEKRNNYEHGLKAKYTGFSIPDKFIIGFGMDYNEKFRELKHTCVISKNAIEKYKV